MSEILHLLQSHGPALLFVVGFLEQIGAPVPAIPVIIVAAAVASNSGAPLLPLLLLTLAGALLADSIWFLLGRRYGRRVLGFLCRISLSPDSCVRQTEGFFERWGVASLLAAKFVPGFSIIAPPMAGSLRVSWPRFFLYDGLGALLWAGASIVAGVVFRSAIDRLLDALATLGGWAVALLAFALLLFVIVKWNERRRLYRDLRMARISPADLHARLREGHRVVILDLRSARDQAADRRRIPGAIFSNAGELARHLEGISAEDEIVLYCT